MQIAAGADDATHANLQSILCVYPMEAAYRQPPLGPYGCSRAHWLTHETNARAKLLYERIAERAGFEHYRKPL